MSINLGIDLGDQRVSAAYERDGTMRMVSFGGIRHAPLAVHIGRDGTIRTGSAATDAGVADPAGLVTEFSARLGDPRSVVVNGYAINGETLVAHLLAEVVDRVAAQVPGASINSIVIAYPPQWTAPLRAGLLAAAGQAGLSDVDAVPSNRAVDCAPENARHLPEQSTALGAAVLAAQRARGTDVAAVAVRPGARPNRPAAPLATSGPTSVFDPTNPDATRPNTVSPLAAAGAAGGTGGAGGGAPPPTPAGGPNRMPFLVAGGVLVALLVLLIVLLFTRDDGSSTASATGATGSSTTTSTSTSTSTTSTSTTTTTTSTSVPKPTSTTSTTTSTTIVAPARIGPVALAPNGLILQFGSSSSFTLRFGDDADGTLSRLVALIGQPTADTGWKQVELCTGDETRRVKVNDLELVFTKNAAGAPNGSRTFQQWFVDDPGKRPDGLVTLDRIGIGSTVSDLRNVYGAALKVVQPIAGDPSGLFTTSESGTFIDGITNGVSDKSRVRQMWAGTACQRVAG